MQKIIFSLDQCLNCYLFNF